MIITVDSVGRSIETEDASRQHRLAERTARFAAAFLRWVETATGDGIPFHHLCLLDALQGHGPAMMRQLGARVGLSARSMTHAVDTLEAEGLVVRRDHPADRRATVVELTEAGRQAAGSALGPRMAAIASLFDDLTPRQRSAFADSVTTLAEGLARRSGEPSTHDQGVRP
ncbi:MAG TPA: MarR family transcriptional regulator [Verrucomicrobiae bacterium]|nr:MarR family transcriptional regulator [Verrucomicrobiae bacterium]